MSMTTAGPLLILLAACGGGEGDSGLIWPTVPVDTGEKVDDDEKPVCLKAGTMTMSMKFGWDGALQQTAPVINSQSGLPERSYFRVNLGSDSWDGDTSVPGTPDVWCFVEWNIDGWTNDGHNFRTLALSGIEVGSAVTNCGQESAPGASDMVPICGRFFGEDDPKELMSPRDWSFTFGGSLDMSVATIPSYFANAGYTTDNFWGAEVYSDFYPQVDSVGYGWAVDENGATKLAEDNSTIKITRDEFEAAEGIPSGLYFHLVPWIFPL